MLFNVLENMEQEVLMSSVLNLLILRPLQASRVEMPCVCCSAFQWGSVQIPLTGPVHSPFSFRAAWNSSYLHPSLEIFLT